MNKHLGEVDRLRAEALALPQGRTRIALLEEAVRLADHHRDVEAGFETRMELIEAGTFGGRPDVSVVAFSWCLAQFDKHPGHFDEYDLLWRYKWIIDSLPEFPQISAEQIASMFADMEKRFQAAGSTLQVVELLRRRTAMTMGDRAAATQAHRAFVGKRRDHLSDCAACELSALVQYLAFQGKYEFAVERAQPILKGRMRCMVVPQITYSHVMLPLVRLGRLAEAMEYHQKGYRLISGNGAKFVQDVATHIEFLTITDNLPRAVKIFDTHLREALDGNPACRFAYFLAGRLLVERLLDAGQSRIRLRWPEQHAGPDLKQEPNLPVFKFWLDEQLHDIADQFDCRNGNDFHHKRIEKQLRLKKLVTPFPHAK